MGSRALTLDRASFPRSSVSPALPRVDSGTAVVLIPDTHERPAKQVTVVPEIKAMQLRGRRGITQGMSLIKCWEQFPSLR